MGDMDDSVLALEQQLQQLDCESESSDSEVDVASVGGGPSTRVEATQENHTGLTMERIYNSTNASTSGPGQLESERMSDVCSLISNSSAASHHSPPAELQLSSIIENDKAFELFRRFLMDQCITRNLNFWLACEHFRKKMDANGTSIKQVAYAIYVKFIKLSAPQFVNISRCTKKNIKLALEISEGSITLNLFDEAQKEIYDIMSKNELRQFLVSDLSTECGLNLDRNNPALYSPSMANPVYGVCGGGSLQNSGSEDSASMTSFSTDDGGARSAIYCMNRSVPSSSTRQAVSDNEGSRSKKQLYPEAYLTQGKPVSREEFALRVRERLQAVYQDRETMTQKARDMLRQQGKTFNEIMTAEWYDLPEASKYLFPPNQPEERENSPPQSNSKLHPPSTHHALSPEVHTPSSTSTICNRSSTSTICNRSDQRQQQQQQHINNLALREVEDAMRDLQVTNQVNRKRISHRTKSGCSSVFSTASDSGVGDSWAASGLATPTTDRLYTYLQRQNNFTSSLPERDRDATAAAIALMSNTPQPDSLNPLPVHGPIHHQQQHHQHHQHHHHQHHHHQHHQQQHHHNADSSRHHRTNFYSSGDDSSSVFTITSASSTSDLFIPRRPPHRQMYTDSDEQHHFSRYRRTLSTPKRSTKPTHGPSPLAEQHRLPSQQQQQQGQRSAPNSGGDILIVYNLDDLPTPYAKRLSGSEITLRDFKERVFARSGDYRFFFKTFCEDLQMEILEEYADDRAVLPLLQGRKIMGRVEKVTV